MPLLQPTKDFLRYLQQNPAVRAQIRAAPGKTLLYAGTFFRPVWQEIAAQKRSSPQLADKQVLPDVLERIQVSGTKSSQSACVGPRDRPSGALAGERLHRMAGSLGCVRSQRGRGSVLFRGIPGD